LIVIDRTNALRHQRKHYLDLGKQDGYLTRIIWLNLDRDECIRRCRERRGHPSLQPEKAEKAVHRFFAHFQRPLRREADSLEIIGRQPDYVPVCDLVQRIGNRRHIILGDVHGCGDEMFELLERLKFDRDRDVLISVGDIIDRGHRIRETVEFLFSLPEFYLVRGNHEEKLLRCLEGRKVHAGGGLRATLAAYGNRFPSSLRKRLASLPLILRTPSGYVVHAGFDPEKTPEEQTEEDCLYMRYHGGQNHQDARNGRLWYTLWPEEGPRVFFGHIPDLDGPCTPNLVSLDGGCVFGGELKAYDSRDGRVHSVQARRAYVLRVSARGSGDAMAAAFSDASQKR
jgi:serine/threonine protein phosphatase 1